MRRKAKADGSHSIGLGPLRRFRKLTQVELAERAGLEQPQIARLERQHDIRVSSLLRYLEGLGAEDVKILVRFEAVGRGRTTRAAPDEFDER